MNASLFALALASLAASPPDVVYDFYSQNCGPCRMMMPTVHRLYAEGYAVQTVDVDQRPDLAQQYSVSQVPTFILVIGGQERQRLIGMQDESTLRALVAQIPQRQRAPAAVADSNPPRPRRSTPVRLVDDDSQSGSKFNFHLPLPSFSSRNQNQGMVQIDQPNPPTATRAQAPKNDDSAGPHNALADAGSPAAATAGASTGEEQAANDRERETRSAADPHVSKMLASSVRIRVRDANGVYFGSGVVIESGRGKSLVLTCGHILRDVKEESRIEVDVFDGNRSHIYRGTIVKYNLESDLGLVAVDTRFPAHVSPIASAEGGVHPGESVVSIGCSQGELPSVERLRVTMLNRYVGPDTIECTGVPGQGRSGGGLFTTRGSVVGICTNADPRDHRGVYAGLKPIHELLRAAGFEDLIPGVPRPSRDSLAEVAPVKTEPAADEPRHVKIDSDMDAPPPARRRRAPARPAEPVIAQSADETEITPKMLEQSEVICIIRPVNQPHAASRVVIVNRASRKFMAYLTGEMKDQLVPAMAHAPRDKSRESDTSVTANDTVRDNRVSTTDPADSTQTTAAWKPTGSR
ncbi:MAG TPA: trypsin-like peptidase domain-containing protein [Planctomycetaceae bacterium]|jgi:thiol-disulfide isomerase/thioredoxin|nr:trypsin-like peptidase domain-containing protein [Planctomycetaceae bacterium]